MSIGRMDAARVAQEDLKFVAVGHVDHGKSTLIGRLLYDTGSLPPDKMDEVRQMSEESDGMPEFAFVMDHLEEERRNRVTIDTAQIFFRTARRDYVIIDAPGHKQFLKNMITGSTQAEAALLLVAAEEGLQEQTHRHAYMLSLLGIRQIVVVVNKMDLVDYDEGRFEEIRGLIAARLGEFGLEPRAVIPIVARQGDNIALRSERMGWYKGSTLLEELDKLVPQASTTAGPLRFPVQDVYEIDGQEVLVGKVSSGTLRTGQNVIFHPLGKTAVIESIKTGFGEPKQEAEAGESIGVVLRPGGATGKIQRGQVACGPEESPVVTNTVTATVFWMSGEPLSKGEELELKCATQEVRVKVKKIRNRLNSSTMAVLAEEAEELRETEVATVTLKAENYVCMDRFETVAETGRFVLMRDTDTVAGGVML